MDELMRLKVVIDSNGQAVLGDLRKLDQAGKTLAGTFKSMVAQAVAFTAGMAGWQALSVAIPAFADKVLGMNARLEQSRIAFGNLLRSAEAARTLLGQLQRFAAETPFEFPELQDAARRMLALGFAAEDIMPMLRAVGDAAAGLGLGSEGIQRIILALGQMQAKAKVSGEEMRQLTEAGIPAWEMLARAIGKNTGEVMKLAEQGVIPADRAIRVLIEGMRERFGGMMQEQSRSFTGLISTIRDNVNMLLADMTRGVFDRAKELVQQVRDLTDRLQEAYRAGGIGAMLEALMPDEARGAMRQLAESAEALSRAFADLGAGAAGVARGGVRVLVEALVPLVEALALLTRGAAAVVEGLSPLVPSLLGAAAVIWGLRLAFTGLVATFNAVRAAAVGMAGSMTALGGALAAVNPYALLAMAAMAALTPVVLSFAQAQGTARREGEDLLDTLDRQARQAEVQAEKMRAQGDALRDLLGRYVELRGALEKQGLAEAEVAEKKVALAQVEQELVGIIGEGAVARLRAAKDVQAAANVEIGAFEASMKAQIEAVTAAKRAKRDQVLALIQDTQKEIEALRTGGDAWRQYLSWWEKIRLWYWQTQRALAGEDPEAAQYAEERIAALEEAGRARGLDQLNDKLDELGTELARLNQELGVGEVRLKRAAGGADDLARSAGAAKREAEELARAVSEALREAQRTAEEQLVSGLDRLRDLTITALRKRYEEERDARTEAIRESIRAEEERVDAILRELDRERRAREEATTDPLRLRIRGIWEEIEALDALTEAEERQAREAEEIARIETLRVQLSEATDFRERQRLQEELARAEQDRQRRQVLEEREARRQALVDQLEDIRAQVEDSLAAFREGKEKELQYLEETYYPKLLEEAHLAAEAEKMIRLGKLDELVTLLGDERYVSRWEVLGVTWGEAFLRGITPSLEAVREALSGTLRGGITVSGPRGVSEANQLIIAAKVAYEQAERELREARQAGTLTPEQEARLEAIKRAAHEQAEEMRRRGGTIGADVSLADLGIELPRYHTGGLVSLAGTALGRFLGLRPGEVPAVLERGEIVLPRRIAEAVRAVLPTGQPAPALAGPIYVDMHDNVFQDGTDAGQRLGAAIWREIRRLGR